MDIKKLFFMVMGVSTIISVIGFVASKISAISGLLAGGALAGVLGSLGGTFGGGGGIGWSRNKNKNKIDQTGKRRFNFGFRKKPDTPDIPSSSSGGKRWRKRKFFNLL